MITSENAFFLYRLLLAHYIADFPLQTNQVYVLKTKGLKGGIIHSSIVALTSAIFLLPVLPKIWPYIILLGFIHWIEDEIRVIIGRKYNLDNLWLFILDQILHIFVSWWVLALSKPWQYFTPPNYIVKYSGSLPDLWNYYYYNDQTIIQIMLFVIVTYAGAILFMYLEAYWMPQNLCYQIGEPRQMLALAERGILFLLLIGQQSVVASAWIGARLLSWIFYRKKMHLYQRRQILAVTVFNWLLVIASYGVMLWMLGK